MTVAFAGLRPPQSEEVAAFMGADGNPAAGAQGGKRNSRTEKARV